MAPRKVLVAIFVDVMLFGSALLALPLFHPLIMLLAALVALLIFLPLMGTVFSDVTSPAYAPVLTYEGNQASPVRSYGTPGVGCSGRVSFEQLIPTFTNRGALVVVSNPGEAACAEEYRLKAGERGEAPYSLPYPAEAYTAPIDGYDIKLTATTIVTDIKAHLPEELFLYGFSQGGCAMIEVIREVLRQKLLPSNRIHPIFDCTPTSAKEVAIPFSGISPYLHGRRFSQFYGKKLVPLFIRVSPKQEAESGVPKELIAENNYFRNHVDGRAQLLQGASIALMEPLKPLEFGGIEALFIFTDRKKDAMVKTDKALATLQAAFSSDSRVVRTHNDNHAGGVELPGQRRRAIVGEMNRVLAPVA